MRKTLFIITALVMLALTGCGNDSVCSPVVEVKNSEDEVIKTELIEATDTIAETEIVSGTVFNTEPATYKQISMSEVTGYWDLTDNYVIVDVRRQDEYDTGHIPGAILIPNEIISSEPPKELPDKNQTIFIYCRSGNRSKQAAEKLVKMGYTNIIEFGGIINWAGEIEK